MPIKTACSCGHAFNAPSQYAGKKVKCPKCKEPLVVPTADAPAQRATQTAARGSKLAVACSCGKTLQVKAELAGKKVKCPACGNPLTIPRAKAKKSAASPEPGGDASAMHGLFADAGLADVDAGGHKCPECKSPMKADDILCIQCGYNENLGRKMEVKRPVTAADRVKKAADRNPDPAAQAAAGKKAGGIPKQLLMLVALVAVVIVIVVVVTMRGTS